MKRNFLLFAVALTLLVTTASAQTVNVKAKIPFNFVVNRATMPAGEYVLESMDRDGGVLGIRGSNAKGMSLVISNACESLKAATHSKLIFHRYGSRYFLSQVWIAGNNRGRELRPSAREIEVAKDFSVQEVVLMVARR
jgi:hypothetical protein